jgi:hypothetical protein
MCLAAFFIPLHAASDEIVRAHLAHAHVSGAAQGSAREKIVASGLVLRVVTRSWRGYGRASSHCRSAMPSDTILMPKECLSMDS